MACEQARCARSAGSRLTYVPHTCTCPGSRAAHRARTTQRRRAPCIRWLQRENPPGSPFVFVSERKAPFSVDGFRRLVQRAAKAAKLKIKCHPHMLRHACGFKLANDGVDTRSLQSYLGHRNIQHTVRYTELAQPFKNFWRTSDPPGEWRAGSKPAIPCSTSRSAVSLDEPAETSPAPTIPEGRRAQARVRGLRSNEWSSRALARP